MRWIQALFLTYSTHLLCTLRSGDTLIGDSEKVHSTSLFIMNRYEVEKRVGDGTYGYVDLVKSKESGTKFAVKVMKKKYYSWGECMQLREIKVLYSFYFLHCIC